MTRVASIGECMIELSEAAGGLMSRSYGGDTLNTAVYLARLGVPVNYLTALGDDPWSEEMLSAWRAEGVGTDLVVRVPGRLPGLHIIKTDSGGQRTFYCWRDSSPARQLFELPQTPGLRRRLGRVRSHLSFGRDALALWRGRPQAAVRGARPRPGPRAPHRLRHQFPHPRLAGSGAGQGRLPRGDRPRRHRARLHGRHRPAVRSGGRGRVASRGPAGRGRAQASRARRSHLPCRQAADRCCGAGSGRDRHDRRGRQLCGRLSGGTRGRGRAGRGSRLGSPPGGSGRAPPRAIIPRSAMPAGTMPAARAAEERRA